MTAIANTQSLHDAVTARLITELEQGRFPWVQPWASSSGGTPLGLPQNASCAHRRILNAASDPS